MTTFTRRTMLAGGLAGAGLMGLPRIAAAAAADAGTKKFLFVIQRGAADGLATLMPSGDPGFAALRPGALPEGGQKIGSDFTLHPALARVGAMAAASDALFAHAVASPYRDRSHFDGQNVLETGGAKAYAVKDGWLNRLLGAFSDSRAVALSPTLPMALRGATPAASFAPSRLPDAQGELMARVGALYAEDAMLGPLWEEAQMARMQAGDAAQARNGAALGELAAKMMEGPGGASIVMVESDGWDTHYRQEGRIARQLSDLDAFLGAFADGRGAGWDDTLVLVATEFGRTARINGTGGTDHGTGALAMLLGGAVKGGRVLADWPGLGASDLYQERDLKPTMALDALIASALSQHFDVHGLSDRLFPATRPALLREALIV